MEEKKKITLQEILWYFIIFSIVGLIIETLYCHATTGIWESRKGLIWGPFCPVYGVGATILILILNQINTKNYIRLFIYGFFIGSILEYFMSYVLEAIYSTRFWDYAYAGMDINGRICLTYAIFWGVLAILLCKFIKPIADKLIKRISNKITTTFNIIIVLFLIIDVIVTIWAISVYEQRATNKYYGITQQHDENKSNIIKIIEQDYFTNERIKRIFPNLRIKDENGKELWIKDIL